MTQKGLLSAFLLVTDCVITCLLLVHNVIALGSSVHTRLSQLSQDGIEFLNTHPVSHKRIKVHLFIISVFC